MTLLNRGNDGYLAHLVIPAKLVLDLIEERESPAAAELPLLIEMLHQILLFKV